MHPEFQFDSQEQWFPVGVEESLSDFGYTWSPSLEIFVQEGNGVERLNFPGSMIYSELPPVVYHRTTVDPYGFWWQQYALWYRYNPWNVAGFGPHEGDWEGLNIATLDEAGDQPLLLCYSQHGQAGKREYWTHCPNHEPPRVYVARGSHANYFQPQRVKTDICDAQGRLFVDYEVRPFETWDRWPGRWGNSSNSPRSPWQQRFWTQPKTALSEAEAQ